MHWWTSAHSGTAALVATHLVVVIVVAIVVIATLLLWLLMVVHLIMRTLVLVLGKKISLETPLTGNCNCLVSYPISTLVLVRFITSWITSLSLLIIISLIIPLVGMWLVVLVAASRLILALVLVALGRRIIVDWRLAWYILRSSGAWV